MFISDGSLIVSFCIIVFWPKLSRRFLRKHIIHLFLHFVPNLLFWLLWIKQRCPVYFLFAETIATFCWSCLKITLCWAKRQRYLTGTVLEIRSSLDEMLWLIHSVSNLVTVKVWFYLPRRLPTFLEVMLLCRACRDVNWCHLQSVQLVCWYFGRQGIEPALWELQLCLKRLLLSVTLASEVRWRETRVCLR